MTNSLPILLALGLNEVVSVLVFLMFLVIWVINQINDARKRQQAQANRPQGQLPPQPVGPAAAAGDAPPQGDSLRTQVDEFLRRTAQQKMQPQVPPATVRKPPGRDEVVVLIDESQPAPPRQPAAPMRSQAGAAAAQRGKPVPRPQPPRAEKPRPPERVAQQRPKSVAEHVATHAGASTQEILKEVSNLGQRVKQADEQFDVQLQKKFDHELGTLSSRPSMSTGDAPAAPVAVSPAAQIVALLSNPDGARQAIVLNEILRRPTDRW